MHQLLLWLFIISWISALIVSCLPWLSVGGLKKLAVFLSLIPLALLLLALPHWRGAQIDLNWLPLVGIHFHLRVDTLSLLFIFLTALIVPISLLCTPSRALTHPRLFYSLVLMLQGILIGFFAARDLALFTIFWEAMLIPLYFIITIWGGANGRQAAFKFLLYMIAGSALMLTAVFALYFTSGTATFDMDQLKKSIEAAPAAAWLFPIFLLAFAVKTPLFPFHAWLPDAYCQAPTAGTILLAALLSKAGIYGILRIGFELFPTYIKLWSLPILCLAITGVLYAGLVAWRQRDFKRLIAYSSFAHVNFILVGLFALNDAAHTGAILQALNHSITITLLFLTAGWLEERLGSTSFDAYSGLAQYLPKLCWLTLFCVLSSVALPGLNNFVGEFLILLGLFGRHPWLTATVGLTGILSVIYMLRWMQKMYFEMPCVWHDNRPDIGSRELGLALPLLLLVIWIGVYPAPLLNQIWPIAGQLLKPS